MRLLKNTWKNRTLLLMSLPAIILFIMFSYVPMFGLIIAFKDYKFSDGIWGSEWCGLDNFRLLWVDFNTTWRLTRNTVGYYLLFTITGIVGKVGLAIGINEFCNKRWGKMFQSMMILPTFITYIAVTMIVYSFLAPNGIINGWMTNWGLDTVNWYLNPKPWPIILLVVQSWKGWGYGSVLYLSVLSGIDQELYEAAALDGANAWQKMRYITIPMLVPMIVITTLLDLGRIMHSDTGLFYQVTKNIGILRSTTQVLDSYVLGAVMEAANYGQTSAISFYQSIVGFIMVVGTNLVVRKISPENSLF